MEGNALETEEVSKLTLAGWRIIRLKNLITSFHN